MGRRHLVGQDRLHLDLDLGAVVLGPADEHVEEEVRQEVLRDDRVLEVEQAGEGPKDLPRDRPLDPLQELVGECADPVAVRRRRRVDGERRRRHGLEIAEREARAEERGTRFDDGPREALPSALRPLVDLSRGLRRED